MAVLATLLGETIVSGSDYVATITLTKDGSAYDLTVGGAAVVTAQIRPLHSNNSATGPITLTDGTPASGIQLLTLTDTQTAAMLGAETEPDYLQEHKFLADVKVVEAGGDVFISEPLEIPVRRGVTA